MKQYTVGIRYCTWEGNLAATRRTIWANDESHAFDLIAARVHKWRRYMGRLDMDCVEVQT
jgi:hypothetical protein